MFPKNASTISSKASKILIKSTKEITKISSKKFFRNPKIHSKITLKYLLKMAKESLENVLRNSFKLTQKDRQQVSKIAQNCQKITWNILKIVAKKIAFENISQKSFSNIPERSPKNRKIAKKSLENNPKIFAKKMAKKNYLKIFLENLFEITHEDPQQHAMTAPPRLR